jgi:indoleamine 2,3-dioxygenase
MVLPKKGVSIKNHLTMIRGFMGTSDELGFMLTHVAINSQSHRQVQSYDIIFEGARKQDREILNKGMK